MSWTASSTSTLSELCRRLDGKPYGPGDDLMTQCLRRALGYVDRTVDPPRFRYLDDRGDYEIVGWVAFDGESVRSDGVDVEPGDDKRTFVWRGRKYPPGVYYLIRSSDGREALVSGAALKSL